jgi:hypothetical protein
MNRLAKCAAAVAAMLTLSAADSTPPILGPYSAAFNFPADFVGTPDTRPTTWGRAGSATNPVVFYPPAGYRVRILELVGNYMAWARGVYEPGNHVGTSWGILTTAARGSSRVPLAADDCFAWLQYGLSNGEINQPFTLDTHVGGLLEADNTMQVVLAVYLNDQPISVHQETTFIAKYQFEPVQ